MEINCDVSEFKEKSQSSTCLFHVCVGCLGFFLAIVR